METSLDNKEAMMQVASLEQGQSDLVQMIRNAFDLQAGDIRSYSPLALAYIGDCIYELVIRTLLIERKISHVKQLHKSASGLVKASAQKDMFRAVESILFEDEIQVYKRGRNVKSSSIAKNATVADYRAATGYEAMIGYLYLLGRMNRILELIRIGLKKIAE